MQRARDARLLRSLLELPAPRGVKRDAWRRYLVTRAAPIVHQVLADLKQPIEGPSALPEDMDERSTPATPAPTKMTRSTKRGAPLEGPVQLDRLGGVLELHGYLGGTTRGPCLQMITMDPRGVTTMAYEEVNELASAMTDWIARCDETFRPRTVNA